MQSASIEGAPFKTGDVVAGRYLIKDCQGQGPVGYVFRALDKEVDIEVALKAISPRLLQTPEERKAFAKEFKGARKLNHNNIARVYEEGEFQDRPYYTSQFLDGLSLRKIIDLRKEKGQYFKLDEIEPILAQIASALDEAHRAGVVHGDLKPENVLVLPDLLKVTDFSLGMAMPRVPFISAQKPRRADRYCAPEYLASNEINSAIDIFSLGVILGEMLGGVLPDGGDMPDLKAANPAVPGPLDAVYRKSTNSNPAARYTRASAFASELATLAGKEDEATPSVPHQRPSGSTANGRPPPPMPGNGSDGTTPGRRPPSRRSPLPPPIPIADSTGEVEITPVARPPPPVPIRPSSSPDLGRVAKPLPPPLLDDSRDDLDPGPTQAMRAGIPTLPEPVGNVALMLPDVVDAEGQASEEPTQAVMPPPELLRAVDSITGQRPPDRRVQAKSKGPDTSRWWILVPILGVVAGVGVGFAYLHHQKDETDKEEEAQRALAAKKAAAEAADAGYWKTIIGEQHEQQDAGPDTALHSLPTAVINIVDAGSPVLASATTTTTTGSSGTTGSSSSATTAAPPETMLGTPKELVWSAEGCPAGMARIAAGSFKMGTSESDPLAGWDDKPLSTVSTKAFCIDLYEYPNQEAAVPKTGVAYKDADSACTDQGKRLCGEDEWERACKGPANSRFTWGEGHDLKACNMGKDPAVSGSFAKCKSGYGVFDLSGNLAEWTSGGYGGGQGGKAIKGAPGEALERCAGRRRGSATSKVDNVGFRCCVDSKQP